MYVNPRSPRRDTPCRLFVCARRRIYLARYLNCDDIRLIVSHRMLCTRYGISNTSLGKFFCIFFYRELFLQSKKYSLYMLLFIFIYYYFYLFIYFFYLFLFIYFLFLFIYFRDKCLNCFQILSCKFSKATLNVVCP